MGLVLFSSMLNLVYICGLIRVQVLAGGGCLCIYNSIFQVPGYWPGFGPVQLYAEPGVRGLLRVQGLAGGFHLWVSGGPHPLLELGGLQQICQHGAAGIWSAGEFLNSTGLPEFYTINCTMYQT